MLRAVEPHPDNVAGRADPGGSPGQRLARPPGADPDEAGGDDPVVERLTVRAGVGEVVAGDHAVGVPLGGRPQAGCDDIPGQAVRCASPGDGQVELPLRCRTSRCRRGRGDCQRCDGGQDQYGDEPVLLIAGSSAGRYLCLSEDSVKKCGVCRPFSSSTARAGRELRAPNTFASRSLAVARLREPLAGQQGGRVGVGPLLVAAGIVAVAVVAEQAVVLEPSGHRLQPAGGVGA